MIRVEHVETWGFDHAIRGMRNPMNSWAKSDSYEGCEMFGKCSDCYESVWRECHGSDSKDIIGPNDLDLMRRLFIGGPEHRKYLRQIFVSMDIIAPDYWFKEFATYRIGVTENSTSTMHKIHAKEFTMDDFSHERLLSTEKNGMPGEALGYATLENTIMTLNVYRNLYLETKNKEYWYNMIQLLPMSYNYRRTVTMNYENVVNMIHQREFHKLDEWREFIEILRGLPYIEEIMKCEK